MEPCIPKGWHSITTRLVVHDPKAMIRFLTQAFCASGDFNPNAPSIMSIGDSKVMVSAVGPREPTAAFLYLYVDDADATYRRAMQAGAVSIEEPVNTPYGDRRAMVKDPFGNDWQVATYEGSSIGDS